MPSVPVTGGDPAAPAGGGATTPAPAPAAIPASEVAGLRDEMANFSQQVVQALQTHAQSIDQRFARGGQPATPAVPATPEPAAQSNILMRLAEGDMSGIDQRVIETLRGSGMIDFLASQATSAGEANEAAARAAIDTEFGPGTYEKEIRPLVTGYLTDSQGRVSRTAQANPTTFNNAVAAAKGHKLSQLIAAKATVETAAAAARAAEETRMRASAPWMPGNGYLPAPGNVLSDEDTATLRRMSEQTGPEATPKPDQAAKLRDMLWQSGHGGVSISELAALFPQGR